MFRTQGNPMDDAVNKATDENLTSENWEYILDVCDKVSGSPSGPQQAVAALIKRLAHRNANVQLYTLELANALSQNCGSPLHRELASKAFTDALLRLAADRNTHGQVKQKVMERMGSWAEEFKSNPELGIMDQAYHKLRMQQPGLMPPSKPVKAEISNDDRRKEEEELQMALALSIKEKGGSTEQQTNGHTIRDDSEPQPAQTQAAQQGTTAATVSRVRALYDFTPSEPGELAFHKGDVIAVLESVYKDWWRGSLRGQSGIFPLNYVEKLQDPTKEELERDAQMEGEVFGEIKNVEKLLALLSVRSEGGGRRGEREEEEISELYQRTLSIRPKLIELIGRYSQKKDDFTQLNEKFIKARRDYEALLESSMSQPQYGQQYPVRGRPQNYAPPQQHPQPPYGGPQAPQGYPPQGSAPPQGYPPQSNFPQTSQQHLQQPPQDPQRFYSPAPSEPPAPQQTGYPSQYPPQNAAPPAPQNPSGPAPFHFIPGGIQAPNQEIRRKPNNAPQPQAPVSADQYTNPQTFQGQIRPNSIHTLNSGNPQELATGGYESPVDNRHSYHAAQQPPPSQIEHDAYYQNAHVQQQGYSQFPPHAQHQQSTNDRDGLPSRQRTHSFESTSGAFPGTQQHYSGQPVGQAPPMAGGAPPGVPTSPNMTPQSAGGQPYQYQAYPGHNQQVPSGGPGGGDPGDYYR